MSQDNADKATALPEPEPTAEPDETIVESTPEVELAKEAPEADPSPAAPEQDEEYEEYEAVYVPAGSVIVTGPSLIAKFGAEVFGTFLLVLAGLGVALYLKLSGTLTGGSSALEVGLAFGLALLAGAIAVGHISGGHFNPAVTLGAAIAGRTPWKDVLPYWLAQLLGGIIAAAVLFITIPEKLPAALAAQGATATQRSFFTGVANGYAEHSPVGIASTGQITFTLVASLLVELVVTALFVGVILGATDRRASNVSAPIAIGVVLAVLIMVAIPVTNASLNPARSTAAAIFSESWALKQLWLFWVAPLVGAALAGLVYRAFASEAPVEDNLLEEDDEYVTTEDALVVTQR